jgi:cysteine-rich repeat protein
VPQAPVDYPGEVLFILNNAFPQPNMIGTPLPAAADEAAAVQCAIWNYTDNMVCDPSTNYGARAAEIVAAANAAGPQQLRVVPQSFDMSPPSATNFLPGDTSHTVTATLRDGNGAALPGFTIDLQVISGPRTGNATSGPSPAQSLTYSNATAGTDTIRATSTFSVPTGQKFKVAGRQGIVLAGAPTNGTITGTATKSWVTPQCGNGVVEGGEECDDGNQANNDSCTNACANAVCGDQIVGPGEQCDDGNQVNNDGCSNACQLPACGDGIVQAGEQCDDGNNLNGDGCSPSCQLSEICTDQQDNDGDGRVDCDDSDCGCLVTVSACGHPCPVRISFKPKSPDRLQFQVNVTPTQSINPANVNVGIALTNAYGVVYAAQLFPGDLKRRGKLWMFRDATAAKGPGIRDGLQVVRVRTKDNVTYRFDVKANSDLLQQLATLPEMTIQLVVGSDAFQQTATWDQLRNGWKVNLQ